ncbi:uncharacterized protein LOC131851353 [Achroia grisella]|uniref:uncharacterized protein LOC131851353 n=1 Tax=Achroia grisella TaxID=688607 RepID=UPI0027D2DDE7|nr:uncharacterized protein LOC131851353 [Achroia grisella]
MEKCDKCNKSITKRIPGLECSRCEKLVHLNTLCSGLSNKQLTAIRASENLEWTCQECQRSTSKRSSIVVPDDDTDEDGNQLLNTETNQINMKKLLQNISKEVEKAVRREINELRVSLQYHSEKMDEVMEVAEACKQAVQDIQRKNIDLINRNKHLETRINAMEQRIEEIEQHQVARHIEISNIPYTEQENIKNIVDKVAILLKQPISDIKAARRLSRKRDSPGVVQVELKEEEMQESWVSASKNCKIYTSNLMPTTSPAAAQNRIFVRPFLTAYNKKLLWSTKQSLNGTYKYIWSKKGKIFIRKDDNSKPVIHIRGEADIKKLCNVP